MDFNRQVLMEFSDCGEKKYRIKAERRSGTSGFHYKDVDGGIWNGRQCPPCLAFHKKTENGSFDTDPMTERKCRVCNRKLPTSRYFTHPSCETNSEYHDWGLNYSMGLTRASNPNRHYRG